MIANSISFLLLSTRTTRPGVGVAKAREELVSPSARNFARGRCDEVRF